MKIVYTWVVNFDLVCTDDIQQIVNLYKNLTQQSNNRIVVFGFCTDCINRYLYNNEIVRDLELACNKSEMMAGHPTSVLAVADDCAATVTDSDPREVLHKI